jgi:hypothetical protein
MVDRRVRSVRRSGRTISLGSGRRTSKRMRRLRRGRRRTSKRMSKRMGKRISRRTRIMRGGEVTEKKYEKLVQDEKFSWDTVEKLIRTKRNEVIDWFLSRLHEKDGELDQPHKHSVEEYDRQVYGIGTYGLKGTPSWVPPGHSKTSQGVPVSNEQRYSFGTFDLVKKKTLIDKNKQEYFKQKKCTNGATCKSLMTTYIKVWTDKLDKILNNIMPDNRKYWTQEQHAAAESATEQQQRIAEQQEQPTTENRKYWTQEQHAAAEFATEQQRIAAQHE